MAVSDAKPIVKRTPEMRDFWCIHRNKVAIISVLVQLLVALSVIAIMIILQVRLDVFLIATIVISLLIISTATNFAVLSFAMIPLRDLSTALVNAAGQKIDQKLPNPSNKEYKATGFSDMLLSIYKEHTETSPDKASATDELASALNLTSTGIIILDKNNGVIFANRAAPISLDAKGAYHFDLLFDDGTDLIEWLNQHRTDNVRARKIWLRVPNKVIGQEDRRIFNITVDFEQGNAADAIITAYDETEIYQPEDDDLDFISFAAHELRGPITVIRGYLDVLALELDSKLEPDQKELFQRLIVSGNRLSGYINNILNTSRYDRRHLKLQLHEDSLATIYETIRDDMELRARSQHRSLSVDIPSDLPTVAADRSSISEVLSNLIDNAIKYSDEGGAVRVTAKVKDKHVEVSVADNGIGIPASVINNLFHKFYRSHRSRETVAGTGIGLYLSKAIIESHGGTIGVSSTEGQGATFTFTLPIYAAVSDKLHDADNSNTEIISAGNSWIKNHTKYTG